MRLNRMVTALAATEATYTYKRPGERSSFTAGYTPLTVRVGVSYRF